MLRLKIESIDKYRDISDTNEQWELKKRFMLAHWKYYSVERLVHLTQIFSNIIDLEFTYPAPIMIQVEKMSRSVFTKEHIKQQNTLYRLLVDVMKSSGTSTESTTCDYEVTQQNRNPYEDSTPLSKHRNPSSSWDIESEAENSDKYRVSSIRDKQYDVPHQDFSPVKENSQSRILDSAMLAIYDQNYLHYDDDDDDDFIPNLKCSSTSRLDEGSKTVHHSDNSRMFSGSNDIEKGSSPVSDNDWKKFDGDYSARRMQDRYITPEKRSQQGSRVDKSPLSDNDKRKSTVMHDIHRTQSPVSNYEGRKSTRMHDKESDSTCNLLDRDVEKNRSNYDRSKSKNNDDYRIISQIQDGSTRKSPVSSHDRRKSSRSYDEEHKDTGRMRDRLSLERNNRVNKSPDSNYDRSRSKKLYDYDEDDYRKINRMKDGSTRKSPVSRHDRRTSSRSYDEDHKDTGRTHDRNSPTTLKYSHRGVREHRSPVSRYDEGYTSKYEHSRKSDSDHDEKNSRSRLDYDSASQDRLRNDPSNIDVQGSEWFGIETYQNSIQAQSRCDDNQHMNLTQPALNSTNLSKMSKKQTNPNLIKKSCVNKDSDQQKNKSCKVPSSCSSSQGQGKNIQVLPSNPTSSVPQGHGTNVSSHSAPCKPPLLPSNPFSKVNQNNPTLQADQCKAPSLTSNPFSKVNLNMSTVQAAPCKPPSLSCKVPSSTFKFAPSSSPFRGQETNIEVLPSNPIKSASSLPQVHGTDVSSKAAPCKLSLTPNPLSKVNQNNPTLQADQCKPTSLTPNPLSKVNPTLQAAPCKVPSSTPNPFSKVNHNTSTVLATPCNPSSLTPNPFSKVNLNTSTVQATSCKPPALTPNPSSKVNLNTSTVQADPGEVSNSVSQMQSTSGQASSSTPSISSNSAPQKRKPSSFVPQLPQDHSAFVFQVLSRISSGQIDPKSIPNVLRIITKSVPLSSASQGQTTIASSCTSSSKPTVSVPLSSASQGQTTIASSSTSSSKPTVSVLPYSSKRRLSDALGNDPECIITLDDDCTSAKIFKPDTERKPPENKDWKKGLPSESVTFYTESNIRPCLKSLEEIMLEDIRQRTGPLGSVAILCLKGELEVKTLKRLNSIMSDIQLEVLSTFVYKKSVRGEIDYWNCRIDAHYTKTNRTQVICEGRAPTKPEALKAVCSRVLWYLQHIHFTFFIIQQGAPEPSDIKTADFTFLRFCQYGLKRTMPAGFLNSCSEVTFTTSDDLETYSAAMKKYADSNPPSSDTPKFLHFSPHVSIKTTHSLIELANKLGLRMRWKVNEGSGLVVYRLTTKMFWDFIKDLFDNRKENYKIEIKKPGETTTTYTHSNAIISK